MGDQIFLREGAILRGVLPTKSTCKAYDFGRLGKTVMCSKMGGPILMIYTSYEEFLRKEGPFGSRDDTAPRLGFKSPKTSILRVNRHSQAKLVKYYRNYCIDSNQSDILIYTIKYSWWVVQTRT